MRAPSSCTVASNRRSSIVKEIHGTATNRIEASPDAIFGLITDVQRLPAWNRAIECVVEVGGALDPGSEWTVKMHPNRGVHWFSRSRVDEIDGTIHRFRYRTWNADGNPSYSDWKWDVTPADGGAQVTVSWDVSLKTLDRRLLAGPIRRRQLRKEVTASLAALDETVRGAAM
jgi:hypothetical protein